MPALSTFLANFSGSDLRSKVLRGSALTTIGFGTQSVLRLGSSLLLTRLLAPEVFGLLSLAMVVLAGLTLLSDIGTRDAVIRSKRGEDEAFLQTAWTIQVLRGCAIGLVACIVAWPAAWAYDQPDLFPLICVLSLTVVIKGFKSISVVTMNRKLILGRIITIEIAVQVVTIGITVFAAWMLRSVWALAIGQISGVLLHLVLSYTVFPRFPHRFRLERETVSEILVFGRWILLATLFGYFGGRGIGAIQGFLLPIEVIGFLGIASKLAWTPGMLVNQVLSKAAYPGISEVARQRPENLRGVLRRVRKLLFVGTVPLFCLLSFMAQPIVDFLYDPRYAMAGTFMSLLALNTGISVLSMPYQSVMLAVGESRAHAFVMGVSAALRIIGVFVGFYLGGVIGILAAVGVATVLVHFISLNFALRRGYAGLRLDSIALALLIAMYLYVLQTISL
ncbi:oligosaccharide flippase family protein [uncultured Roseobacter sp.]|uniref:oligosaccharide flippase family protein n=1 Tax=uncultured Roseobacter sp. TaxID=114847 RepID=UPI00262EC648|nr:oligosaccharide flippase family protein [uncultured Roseobacter sp.]